MCTAGIANANLPDRNQLTAVLLFLLCPFKAGMETRSCEPDSMYQKKNPQSIPMPVSRVFSLIPAQGMDSCELMMILKLCHVYMRCSMRWQKKPAG
jgi:hypothetical protein